MTLVVTGPWQTRWLKPRSTDGRIGASAVSGSDATIQRPAYLATTGPPAAR